MPPGDSWECLETILGSHHCGSWGVPLASSGWAPGCCRPPYNAQDRPPETRVTRLVNTHLGRPSSLFTAEGPGSMASGLDGSGSRPSEDAREGVGCIPLSSPKPLLFGAAPSRAADRDIVAPSGEEGSGPPVPRGTRPPSSGLRTPRSLFFATTV